MVKADLLRNFPPFSNFLGKNLPWLQGFIICNYEKKSLSLSLITSIESISEPSSFVKTAFLASNPNFSPVKIAKNGVRKISN